MNVEAFEGIRTPYIFIPIINIDKNMEEERTCKMAAKLPSLTFRNWYDAW